MEDKLVYSTGPELTELLAEYGRAGLWGGLGTTERNEERRLMVWDGQSDDGRKWDENQSDGEPAKPWDGAADTRVPLCDEVINEQVATCVAAFGRAMTNVKGVGWEDASPAAQARQVIDWLVRGKLRAKLGLEVELSAQYAGEYGWCVLHVGWDRAVARESKTVSLPEVAMMAGQMGGGFETLPDLVINEAQDETSAAMIQTLYGIYAQAASTGVYAPELPNLTLSQARKAVRELRQSGEAAVPLAYVCRNEPFVRTLKPIEEVVLSSGSTDIQTAKAVFVRRLMSQANLRAEAVADGWNERWVEEACKTAGQVGSWKTQVAAVTQAQFSNASSNWVLVDTKADVVEIVYAYSRRVDAQGIPGVYCTVFCPAMPASGGEELVAKHELEDYGHGRYPFVVYRRERRSRVIADSRSVCDIGYTWQSEEKEQRDMLFNRSQWETLPSLSVPKLMGVAYRFGPGAQIPEARAGGIKPIELTSKPANVALELIKLLQLRTDNYFGRPSAEVPPYRAQVLQEKLVTDFLAVWSEVMVLMFALQVQFDPDTIATVTSRPWPRDLSPRRILDQVDLVLQFDVRELNPDYLWQKLEAVSKTILPEDAAGVIDRAALTKAKLRMLDPVLADELVMDKGAASQKLFRDTHNQVALMALGNEPEYSENDPSAQSKLQFLRDIIGRNPKYQQALQTDPRFQELVMNYEKNLSQSVVQEQNKVVGRLGVKPVDA